MRQLRKNVTWQVRDAMTFAITLTVVAVFLSAAAIVILAILVAAIRSDDRAKNLTHGLRISLAWGSWDDDASGAAAELVLKGLV